MVIKSKHNICILTNLKFNITLKTERTGKESHSSYNFSLVYEY